MQWKGGTSTQPEGFRVGRVETTFAKWERVVFDSCSLNRQIQWKMKIQIREKTFAEKGCFWQVEWGGRWGHASVWLITGFLAKPHHSCYIQIQILVSLLPHWHTFQTYSKWEYIAMHWRGIKKSGRKPRTQIFAIVGKEMVMYVNSIKSKVVILLFRKGTLVLGA